MKKCDEHCDKEFPSHCSTLGKFPQYSCLFNNCPYVSFTSCENVLCYVNNEAESEYEVEWDPDIFENDPDKLKLWRDIACKKALEAQEEFAKTFYIDEIE